MEQAFGIVDFAMFYLEIEPESTRSLHSNFEDKHKGQ